jgi:hypothetical protein
MGDTDSSTPAACAHDTRRLPAVGYSSQSKTIIYPKSAVYRAIRPARTMNVERPISKKASKKHIASPLYYTSDKTVGFN